MKRMMIAAAAIAIFAAQGVQVQAAEGLPGATVRSDGKGSAEMRAKMEERRKQCEANPEKCQAERKARMEQFCKANPEKCQEMKARQEKCKADPDKCRAEKQARREQWCKDNPEKCREMKAKMEERRKQCEADPSKCPPRKGPGRI